MHGRHGSMRGCGRVSLLLPESGYAAFEIPGEKKAQHDGMAALHPAEDMGGWTHVGGLERLRQRAHDLLLVRDLTHVLGSAAMGGIASSRCRRAPDRKPDSLLLNPWLRPDIHPGLIKRLN